MFSNIKSIDFSDQFEQNIEFLGLIHGQINADDRAWPEREVFNDRMPILERICMEFNGLGLGCLEEFEHGCAAVDKEEISVYFGDGFDEEEAGSCVGLSPA